MALNRQKGFTLFEMMVVLVVFTILASIGMSTLATWIPRMKLKSSARDVYSSIQRVKLEAVNRSVCTGMKFTTVSYPTTGGKYTAFVDDGAGTNGCNGAMDAGEESLFEGEVEDNVSLVTAQNIGGTSAICFNPTTVICNSESGNVDMRIADRWYRITMTASGGMRMRRSDDGGTWSE